MRKRHPLLLLLAIILAAVGIHLLFVAIYGWGAEPWWGHFGIMMLVIYATMWVFRGLGRKPRT